MPREDRGERSSVNCHDLIRTKGRGSWLGRDISRSQITVAAAGLPRQLGGQKAEQGQRDHALPAERPACLQGDIQHFWINQRGRRRGSCCCPLEEGSLFGPSPHDGGCGCSNDGNQQKYAAMTRPPKTAPSSADSQAYPATHRDTNAIAAAVPATANQAKKPAVSPVFAWIQRMMFC